MRHHMRRRFRQLALTFVLLGAACGESGLQAPRDPGTVLVRVRDEQAAPVSGAGVSVQMPNTSGGLFEVGTTTRADGSSTISAVPAGPRRVSVTPPAGYAAGSDPLVQIVNVVKGETVRVEFVLRRGTGTATRSVRSMRSMRHLGPASTVRRPANDG
jgi:hypothetical protein